MPDPRSGLDGASQRGVLSVSRARCHPAFCSWPRALLCARGGRGLRRKGSRPVARGPARRTRRTGPRRVPSSRKAGPRSGCREKLLRRRIGRDDLRRYRCAFDGLFRVPPLGWRNLQASEEKGFVSKGLFHIARWRALVAATALICFGPRGEAAAETLTIAQGNDILSLDPANHGNNSTESALVNIYDDLVNKDFSRGGNCASRRASPCPGRPRTTSTGPSSSATTSTGTMATASPRRTSSLPSNARSRTRSRSIRPSSAASTRWRLPTTSR